MSGVPATDRRRNPPFFGGFRSPLSGVGIDTIAIRGEVKPSALRALGVRRYKEVGDPLHAAGMTATSSDGVLKSGRRLRVDTWRNKPEATFELSVPTVLYGDNRVAASLNETMRAVSMTYAEVGEVIGWVCPLELVTIMRLDLVRDFGGACHPHELLRLLRDIVPRRMLTSSVEDRRGRGVQTLYRTTNRWESRSYVKGDEVLDHGKGPATQADLETIRVELQLKSRYLKECGMHEMGLLDQASMEAVAFKHFTAAALDREVGGGSDKLREVIDKMRASGDAKAIVTTLGQALLDALGEQGGNNSDTVRGYRALAEQYDLRASDVFGRSDSTMRLDWATSQVLQGGP